MRYVKSKSELSIKVCFTPKELIALTFSKNIDKIVDILKNSQDLEKAKKQVTELSSIQAKSRLYENFVAIFDLYELFDQECEFCFNLKPSFSPSSNTIISLEDLEKNKVDPPDIIVSNKKGFYDFELKRYRGKLETLSLLKFLKEKIINHYSDHNRNYLIILQSETQIRFGLEEFKNLSVELKKLNKNLGRIAFSFNNNNQESILIIVWPNYKSSKRPFLSGSEQVKRILEK